jgi:O-antigen ligase
VTGFLAGPAGLVFVALVVGGALLGLAFACYRGLSAAAPDPGPAANPSSTGSFRADLGLAALLAAAAAILPLVFTIALPDVFVLPKLVFLEVVLLLGLALHFLGSGARPAAEPAPQAATQSAAQRPTRPRDIDLLLALYAGLTILATIVSVSPARSLAGTARQYQGLLTTLILVAFFLLGREALARPGRLRMLATCAVGGSMIVAAYGVAQLLGIDPIWDTLDKGRVFSTIGQAEWLGAYLVIPLALAVGLLASGSAPGGHAAPERRAATARRAALGAGLALLLVALLVTLTRGAYLGLGVAAVVLAAGIAPRLRPSRRSRRALPVAAVVLGLLVLLPPLREQAATVLSRAASIADLSEGSIADRLDLWRVGVAIAIDHPALGTGPETYTLDFPEYRDTVLEPSRSGFWLAYGPESPHNVILAVADGAGMPALAACLGFLALAVRKVLRAARRAGPRERPLLVACAAGGLGYLVSAAFMTGDMAGQWLLWLVLGGCVGYAELADSQR